jgi:hypothetical protein
MDQSHRERDRSPIFGVMKFIPIDGTGKLVHEWAQEVVGKDLSRTGISFSHTASITCRRGVVVIQPSNADRVIFEVEVVWTKILPTSLRETGCRLIRNLTPQ